MIDSPLAFPSGAYGHPGMTLRDYFAAAALQGIVAKYGMQVPDFDYPDEIEIKPTQTPVGTDKFSKKNIFTVTPIQAADKKAVYIGKVGSSCECRCVQHGIWQSTALFDQIKS